MGDETGTLYFVTYTGNDVVTLGKAGVFQKGTGAYVGEADANAARAIGQFTVSGPLGGPPKVEKVSAKDATRAEEKARAKAEPPPPPPPAPAKHEEKKAEEKKPEEKKHDEKKPEEKKHDEKKHDEKKPEEKKHDEKHEEKHEEKKPEGHS